jgi:hypothetical protein
MDFQLRSEFPFPLETVAAALYDKALLPFLAKEMALVREIERLEQTDDGTTVRRRVRYQPVPLIEKVGPKKVPPAAMAWIEESTFDRRSNRAEFVNVAVVEKVRKLLDNSGTIALRDLGNGRTERVISGKLKVKVPLLGSIAEKLIYANAEKILQEERAVFLRYLQSRAG